MSPFGIALRYLVWDATRTVTAVVQGEPGSGTNRILANFTERLVNLLSPELVVDYQGRENEET